MVKSVTVWEGSIPIESSYTSGVAGEKTLKALKEKGVFLATHCPACEKTYFPARMFCEICFEKILDNEKTIGPQGTLKSWTISKVDQSGKKLKKPQTFGLIQLDGSNTLFLHRLKWGQVSLFPLGSRVKPILKDPAKRRGSITDILAFEPQPT